jgi:hypothetical protein
MFNSKSPNWNKATKFGIGQARKDEALNHAKQNKYKQKKNVDNRIKVNALAEKKLAFKEVDDTGRQRGFSIDSDSY